jgi:S-adenosylmethionine:tRNA ribosyltransferase-isomerase
VDLKLFDYPLLPERIAQYPAEQRDASRLLVLDRAARRREDRRFVELPDLLRPGDCLVVNDSRVLPARLLGTLPDGAPVELLFLRDAGAGRWEVLVKPGRRVRVGTVILLGGHHARVIGAGDEGRRVIWVEGVQSVRDFLDRHGLPPLPPYIRHYTKPGAEDWERYQTVYGVPEGSVAAPTAGLHFTKELLDALRRRGVEVRRLTLHVGPATFRPIRTARIEDHRMEAERMEISEATAVAVNRAKAEGRRVVAVGTTTTRALESAAADNPGVRPVSGAADLFIAPGYRFRVIDALLTNFHLPRSSLLVLVSAFAGRELILDAYRHAAEAGYRFYSYGDAMLIQ